jgi:NAD(P)H dehydrogenase (quinone)
VTRDRLVIGATGKTGRHTTELLLQHGHRVRVLVHRADDRSEKLAALGAETVTGDVHDLNALAAAMKGIEAAYFTYPIPPGLLDATANVAQAAAENQVGAIVNMSQISARREAASNAARQHWVAERLLDRSPAAVTHLRPTFFAEWLINFWDGTGMLRLPLGDGHHAPVTAADQAKVIAAILKDPAPHAGQTYPLYGPVELNHYEIAETMTRVLGREVTYVPVDFAATLERQGRPQHLIQHLSGVTVDYRNGIFSGTNDLVKAISGSDPTDVETFIAQNKPFYDTHAA